MLDRLLVIFAQKFEIAGEIGGSRAELGRNIRIARDGQREDSPALDRGLPLRIDLGLFAIRRGDVFLAERSAVTLRDLEERESKIERAVRTQTHSLAKCQ